MEKLLTLKIGKKLHKQLKNAAFQQNKSIGEFVRESIEEKLKT